MQLSIIIPTFNSEKYLQQTMVSVLTLKNFMDFEVIVVDDGSTDDTRKILSKYSKLSNFNVFYNHHKGVSSSRNFGMAQATGSYIAFVDSDDLIDSSIYYKMITSAYRKSEPDIISCSRFVSETNDQRLICSENDRNKLLLSNLYVSNDEFSGEEYISGPVSKLYKRSFLKQHQIEFPQAIDNGEDLIFNCHAIIHSQQILLINGLAYYYRHNLASLMFKKDLEIGRKNQLFLTEIQRVLLKSALSQKSDYLTYWLIRLELTNVVRLYWHNPKQYFTHFQKSVVKIRVGMKHKAVKKLICNNLSLRQLIIIELLKRLPMKLAIQLIRVICIVINRKKIQQEIVEPI